MSRRRRLLEWSRSLSVRVMMFLSLALLPIGLIAVVQTREVTEIAQKRSELGLLAMTEHASSEERRVIQRAFGAAEALGVILRVVRDRPDVCRRYLSEYLTATQRYSFVGIQPVGAPITCSSSAEVFDPRGSEIYDTVMADPKPRVIANREAPVSQTSVLVAMQPYYEAGAFGGYILVSVPHSMIPEEEFTRDSREPLGLVTFNAEGAILTSEEVLSVAQDKLPKNVPLQRLFGSEPTAFSGLSKAGEHRVFAVVPIVPGTVYAIATWPKEAGLSIGLSNGIPASVFPIFMWLASLLVAYLALHRLVIRHVRSLSLQMRDFAHHRVVSPSRMAGDMSSELLEVQDSFRRMAFDIQEDEAALEEVVADKNVLLKEVHHRVKNNLQLISSIMSMQMRKTQNVETLDVLRRLQDRMMGLATIHRNLYQTENLSSLNAGALLRDIASQSLVVGASASAGVALETDIDDIVLYPDQAVPLSLLASEALTNALKHIGAVEGSKPWVKVTFHKVGTGQARLSISNSKGAAVGAEASELGSTGLGSQLMQAFAAQIEGEIVVHSDEAVHDLQLLFTIQEFSPEG